jgi:ABC-type sugar transport system substrate-binding protein
MAMATTAGPNNHTSGAVSSRYGKPEGQVALITSIPGVGSLDQRAKGFKEEIAGYEGIKTALAASKGEKVPETVDTGVNLITKENMNFCSFLASARMTR